jgi:hypothetical protein
MSFTFSSVIAAIENDISTTEADVWNAIINIQSGLAVLEADIQAGLAWVGKSAPAIASDLSAVLAVASAIPGLQIPAAVITGTAAAAAALTAVANAENLNKTTPQTLVAAYGAVVQAVGAKSTLQQVVTSLGAVPAPVTAPAA